MINLPIIRWGSPYESLEKTEVVHFATGEPVARVSQTIPTILRKDLRRGHMARKRLRQIPIGDLVQMAKDAGELFLKGTLPIGDSMQSPEQFVRTQSATTGLPEHMCHFNMGKNHFVLTNMDKILAALTRNLDPHVLSTGYGTESYLGEEVMVSWQANSPVAGYILPNNSPGVHALWMPVIPMQVGLVLKPGSAEPWTAYRMFAAFTQAGIPPEVMGIYPGGHELGSTLLEVCERSVIFGGQDTVDKYAGNPRVQAHGPGYSKVIIGDDLVDRWEDYLDVMVASIYANSGRSCINASAVWASRHTEEIADALAQRLANVPILPPNDPNAGLAAFVVPKMAQGINAMVEADLRDRGAVDVTAKYRVGERLIMEERCGYLRPTIVHCASPETPIAKKEFMFPFATIVKCPQERMVQEMGYTLVCSAITNDPAFRAELTDASNIDRLNFGAVPTVRINWLQPHEGNLVDFLFRARAYQAA